MRRRHEHLSIIASARAGIRPLGLGILLGLMVAGQAAATTFVRVADQDLADGAGTIVEAVVLDATPASAAGYPATDVSLSVSRVIKGDATLAHVTVRLPGGLDPASGMELVFHGTPELRQGARALLFLAPSKQADAFRLRHLFQGFFHIATVNGEDVAYRSFGQAHELHLSGRKALAPEGPRDLERFVLWLADRSTGDRRPADYASTAELEKSIEWNRKYNLLNRQGFPTRWPDFDGGGSVSFYSHNSSQPGLPSGGHAEFSQAISAWVNDGGSNVRYVYRGQNSAGGGLSTFDNINSILWNDPGGIFDEPFSCTEGGTIAGAGPWTSPDPEAGRHDYNGRTFTTIFGADVVTNLGISCWINRLFRAQEVFAHELGHTLGLGHSCSTVNNGCSNGTFNQALMRAQAHGDGRGAALNSDDRAGIAFLYGANVQPPNAPSNLTATATGVGQVQLSWNDNSSNESSFEVERRTGSGGFSQIGSTGSNVRSFTDNTVASGTSYTYQVSARNSAGSSAASNSAGVTTPGDVAPSNFTAQVLSATSTRLTWTDNSSETGFEIDADGFGAFFPVARPGANATSATITGLNPNTQYTFRIRAVGSATGSSSYVLTSPTTTTTGTPEPCVAGGDTQCLRDGRFKVQVGWRNFEDNSGTANVVDVESLSSGLFWFFDENNWEMLVKVLDGCVLTDHFWVFAAATTNLQYHLLVIDTETGNGAVYENPLGTSSAAITDTEALPCGSSFEGEPSPAVVHRSTTDPALRGATSSAAAWIVGAEKADCTADESSLCLSGSRFKVEVDWLDFADNQGRAKVVDLPVVADDSGLFWFFQSDNWEMLVKVLDGCGINNNFWVFSAATTNVEYTLKVTDTDTGQIRQYTNPLGSASPAITDIEAFNTCP